MFKEIMSKIDEVKEDLEHMRSKERILCSAIWFKTEEEHPNQPTGRWMGLTVCGLRHNNCYHIAYLISKDLKNLHHEQGFLTSKNRFVDRVEAASIAFLAGQTKTFKKKLFSEDLY
jgi:hypothetical protein